MKFVLVGPTFPFRGGIAHHTTLLYQSLSRCHQGELISFRRQYPAWLFPGKSDLDPSMACLRTFAERIIDPLNPLSWWQCSERIRNLEPDVVIVQWWVPFWALAFGTIARCIKHRTKTQVLFICHNVLPHESMLGMRWLTRYALGAGDHFIVHSQTEEEKLRDLLPRASVARSVIPSYAPLGELNKAVDAVAAKAALGLQQKHVSLFFGFVRPYKGLRYLIEALPAVVKRVDLHLLIVGEFWEPVEEYEEMIARLGIESSVTIVNRYIPNEELAQYFSAADVVILPYESATQSAVVQLAFGFGVPVITTRVGGLGEAVDDGETGLLVPPANSLHLADAIVRFFSEGMGAAFRVHIQDRRSHFGWDRLVSVIEAETGMGT